MLMYPDAVMEFMRRAHQAKLTNGDNAFVAIDFAGTHNQSELMKATFLNGMMDITYDVVPERPEFKNFLASILPEVNYGINPLLLSDAMFLVATAFNTSLSLGIPLTQGAFVLSQDYATGMSGLVNPIDLDATGSRKGQFMLHNIQDGCYVPVARSSVNWSSPLFLPNHVIWPGGSRTPPSGKKACGWNNEFCPLKDDSHFVVTLGSTIGTVALLLLMVVGLLGFFYWKRLMRTALSRKSITSGATSMTSRLDHPDHYHCPVVLMDVEGVWSVKFIQKTSVHVTSAIKRELNMVRSLKHQNINTFVGACLQPEHVCLVWSYSSKGSLMDLIHSGNFQMEFIFQLSFAQDIARGLAYLHNSDLTVHGRLKSSNVLVDSGLVCKLTDIDTPRFREGETTILTEADPELWFQQVWTAPEHLRTAPRPGTQKGDIYAYGIILYEIFFKRKPYCTEDHLKTGREPDWKEVINFVRHPEKFAELQDNRHDSVFTASNINSQSEHAYPYEDFESGRHSVWSGREKHLMQDKSAKKLKFNSVFPLKTLSPSNNKHGFQICWNKRVVPPDPGAESEASPARHTASGRCVFRPEIPQPGNFSKNDSYNEGQSNHFLDVPRSNFSFNQDAVSKANDQEVRMVKLMCACWSEDPNTRPTAEEIVRRFGHWTKGGSVSDKIEQIMHKYGEQLEQTVKERTRRLEEEKVKYLRVLCEVIPQKYINLLVSGEKVPAESFPNVSIFFSDIVGFTTICGMVSPQEVLNFLNDLYTRFDLVLNSYQVYKVETIGDAYMVAAGIPEQIPNHAEQIAHMALNLLSISVDVRAPYVDSTGVKSSQSLKLRIGLNSGPVVAGIVGEKMPRYCLYGDTVNIASRMESNGQPLRIHLSEAIKRELDAAGGFHMTYRGLISIKGKDTPIPTYWLEDCRHHAFVQPDWRACEREGVL
ncbi:atrial natriuretic peptide receptor 2-like [Physella acuta]|uniref:atrial natriuretic peptide receptor 2-like n=1 Tax=Physella acuta TaxID=109671 RepID=UPI0027DCFD4C|nr:atrial natriuretic peptide receptor 2-like [Physella acuta]